MTIPPSSPKDPSSSNIIPWPTCASSLSNNTNSTTNPASIGNNSSSSSSTPTSLSHTSVVDETASISAPLNLTLSTLSQSDSPSQSQSTREPSTTPPTSLTRTEDDADALASKDTLVEPVGITHASVLANHAVFAHHDTPTPTTAGIVDAAAATYTLGSDIASSGSARAGAEREEKQYSTAASAKADDYGDAMHDMPTAYKTDSATPPPENFPAMEEPSSSRRNFRASRAPRRSYNESILSGTAKGMKKSTPAPSSGAEGIGQRGVSGETLVARDGDSQPTTPGSVSKEKKRKLDGDKDDEEMLLDVPTPSRRKSVRLTAQEVVESVAAGAERMGKRGREAVGKVLARGASLRGKKSATTAAAAVAVEEGEEDDDQQTGRARKRARIAHYEITFAPEDITSSSAAPMESKKPRKMWLRQGLYVGQFRPGDPRSTEKRAKRGKKQLEGLVEEGTVERTILPLPMFHGERVLELGRDFKLPHDILSPLPREQAPKDWRVLRSNRFIGDAAATWKKYNLPESYCTCTPESGCDEDCLNRNMQYECNDNNCAVGKELCTNRAFAELKWRSKNKNVSRTLAEGQKADAKANMYGEGVEVVKTKDRGYGVRAMRGFKPGQVIVEYAGEIITQDEADRRMNEEYKDKTDYYLMTFHDKMIIDATRGSICRFVNHSCEPNCRVEKWVVSGQPRMALFAGECGIAPGEELTYDYNFSPFSEDHLQACLCGTPSCRGFLSQRPNRTDALRAEREKAREERERVEKERKKEKRRLSRLALMGGGVKRGLKAMLGSAGGEGGPSPKKRKTVAGSKGVVAGKRATKAAVSSPATAKGKGKAEVVTARKTSKTMTATPKACATKGVRPVKSARKAVKVVRQTSVARKSSGAAGKRAKMALVVRKKTGVAVSRKTSGAKTSAAGKAGTSPTSARTDKASAKTTKGITTPTPRRTYTKRALTTPANDDDEDSIWDEVHSRTPTAASKASSVTLRFGFFSARKPKGIAKPKFTLKSPSAASLSATTATAAASSSSLFSPPKATTTTSIPTAKSATITAQPPASAASRPPRPPRVKKDDRYEYLLGEAAAKYDIAGALAGPVDGRNIIQGNSGGRALRKSSSLITLRSVKGDGRRKAVAAGEGGEHGLGEVNRDKSVGETEGESGQVNREGGMEGVREIGKRMEDTAATQTKRGSLSGAVISALNRAKSIRSHTTAAAAATAATTVTTTTVTGQPTMATSTATPGSAAAAAAAAAAAQLSAEVETSAPASPGFGLGAKRRKSVRESMKGWASGTKKRAGEEAGAGAGTEERVGLLAPGAGDDRMVVHGGRDEGGDVVMTQDCASMEIRREDEDGELREETERVVGLVEGREKRERRESWKRREEMHSQVPTPSVSPAKQKEAPRSPGGMSGSLREGKDLGSVGVGSPKGLGKSLKHFSSSPLAKKGGDTKSVPAKSAVGAKLKQTSLLDLFARKSLGRVD